MRPLMSLAVVAVLVAACGPAVPEGDQASGETGGRRYGVGTPASVAAVARVDRDIGADGVGLPPGRGTVVEGERVYQAQCANCHGAAAAGMGSAYPALAGREPREGFAFGADPRLVRTIGNYWSHATALVDYIRRAMPFLTPGSLSDNEVYAVSAYLLALNELLPMDGALDSAAVMAIRMPAADRFVRDDRRGGSEVK